MRTRTRNNDYQHFLEATVAGTMPGIGTVNYGVDQTWNISKPETMDDVISPGYFRNAREGKQLPVNPMSHVKYNVEASYDTHTWDITSPYYPTYDPDRGHFSGHPGLSALHSISGYVATQYWNDPNMYPISTPNWPSTTAVLQQALARANTSRWDLLTFMAEFNKTNDLVGKFKARTHRRAQDVAKAYSRRTRRAQRTVRGFQETWLEARYGWRILMYDYINASEAIERLKEVSMGYERYSSYDEDVGTYEANYSGLSLAHYGGSWYSHSSNRPLAANCEYIKTYIKSVHAGVAVEHLGNDMYFANPLLTAWEIVPFSFVVDWFSNIGDAIAAHSPFASTNLLWSYVTAREEKIAEVHGGVYPNYPGGWPNSGTYIHQYGAERPFSALYSKTSVERFPQDPSFNLSYQLNFDYAKAIDLVALIPALRGILRGAGIMGRR